MDIIKSIKRDVHVYYVEQFLGRAKWAFRLCGAWSFDENWLYSLLAFYYMGLSCVIMSLQHVFIYQHRTNFDYIFDTYTTMIPVLFIISKQVILFIHRKEYKRLLATIRNDFWPINSFDDDKSIENIFITVHTGFIFYMISVILTAEGWMVFPPDPIPGHRKMPICVWFPFDAEKSPLREIIYVKIMTVSLFMSLGISTYEYIFFQIILHLYVQFKLMRRYLRSINNGHITDKNNSNHDKHTYEELIFFVNHHILIKKFFEDAAVLLNANIGIHFTLSSFATVVLLYLIRIEPDPVKQIKLIAFITLIVIELAIYCFAGTIMEEMSKSLSYAAYESKWYELHPKFRLALIRLMQMSNSRPLCLSCYGLFYLNNAAFISVLKTAFSISTFLVTMRNIEDK